MSQKSPLQAKKKGFTMPHTFVILLVIILFAVALTWIIPSGEYARVEDPVSGKKVVDASTFNYVENVHVNIQDIPMLIIKAFSANSDLIMLILLSGGAIHMLTASGADKSGTVAVACGYQYIFLIGKKTESGGSVYRASCIYTSASADNTMDFRSGKWSY